MRFVNPSLLAFSALVLASVGTAQVRIANDGRANKVPVPRAGVTAQDLSFLKDAAIANMFEIATSRVAVSRASSPWAKQYAKEMMDEHVAANDELGIIAKDAGVSLPTGLPADKLAIVTKLQSATSAGFDEWYRSVQIDSHNQASGKFDKEVKSGHDSAVRNYAIKTLPAIRTHLKLAKLRKTMMGPTKIQTNQ